MQRRDMAQMEGLETLGYECPNFLPSLCCTPLVFLPSVGTFLQSPGLSSLDILSRYDSQLDTSNYITLA